MAATTLLFDGVRTAATITRRVIVFYSGGKDSAVTLDLCARYFDEVRVVFMQLGPDADSGGTECSAILRASERNRSDAAATAKRTGQVGGSSEPQP